MSAIDPNLKQYATEAELRVLEAVERTGSVMGATRALELSRGAVRDAIARVKRRAGQRGYAPLHGVNEPVGPGMLLKGSSTLRDGSGAVKEQWIKTTREGRDESELEEPPDPKTIIKTAKLIDASGTVTQQWVTVKRELVELEQQWRAFIDEITKQRITPAEPVPAPENGSDNLLASYPVGDHHMGMLSWSKETGRSYDIEIAENLLCRAIDYLPKSVARSGTALVPFLGDFMHYDSMKPLTPASGNLLDTDTRAAKMVRASIRAMRYTIDVALRHHARVRVIVEPGNHDPFSSLFMQETLRCIYENEPRVEVDTSPKLYHYFRFGKVLIGTHHGDKTKLPDLPLIMATDVPEDWGATEHRYIYVGHVHHSQRLSQKDYPGCQVESFKVLPPPDAWHHQEGFRPRSSMQAIVYHREYGEVARNTVTPEMLA